MALSRTGNTRCLTILLMAGACLAFSSNALALRVYKCTDLNDETVTYSFKRCSGQSVGGLIDVIDNSAEAAAILEHMRAGPTVRDRPPKRNAGKPTRFSADADQCESALKQLETEIHRAVSGDSSRQFEQTLKIKNLKATYEGACGKLPESLQATP